MASARASTRLRAGVGSLGKHPGAELADEPRGAVATAGAGAIRGAEPIQDDRQAGGQDAGPVLIRRVGAAGLGGEGDAHQARLSVRYSGVTRSLLTT
jgi:hypothetical protein